MKNSLFCFLVSLMLTGNVSAQTNDNSSPRVKVENGILEGVDESGVNTFKGIPYAAPPVGEFRWREPQPVKNWEGLRKADKFGKQAMQLPIFGDMNFRSSGTSEDCLYLNIWAPSNAGKEKLPVLVYYYGGGFMAGDGSEPRYDGESMARHGIVTVTVNYRLGVFGLLSHPELTKESPHHGSGNYGLMDQSAALQWVQKNIAAFGGDPKKVTIAGESAGSFSVCAQMASPLSRNLIAGAIGESGSVLGNPTATLQEAEAAGVKWAQSINKNSLAELRAMSAEDLLKGASKAGFGAFPFCVDGYFFPKSPAEIFEKGEQAHVPLMAGWNSQEMVPQFVMGGDKLTVENFKKALQKTFGDKADEAIKQYVPATDEEVEQAATEFASDRFIAFGTWRWIDLQAKTGGKPVYRYLYAKPRPAMRAEMGNATANLAGGVTKDTSGKAVPKAPLPKGAVHSAEIEYAMGNLPTNRVYDWQPEDYKVSAITQTFFVNFIKTGDPNGLTAPKWLPVKANQPAEVMYINVDSKAAIEKNRGRYLFLESLLKK
ncbi:MAG: carboxylesterase family protein [Sphingobacteriales bacterium]|nr:carboxylesterase family protein [Sphingobacteriales bacterium]MBI3720528.1 carboxylesterase family protein [Sphingobacteriales bacterium]